MSREKREQVIALGRLGWSLRRIEQATGVRRETASEYLRGAGIALRRPGGWGRHSPSKPAIDPITDSKNEDSNPAINLITDSGGVEAKPAIEVITDFSLRKSGCGPASNCEPYGELIALELDRGRNAMGIWQLCRARHSCQNAEFSTMPSRDQLARVFVLQTPIVTGILRGLPN